MREKGHLVVRNHPWVYQGWWEDVRDLSSFLKGKEGHLALLFHWDGTQYRERKYPDEIRLVVGRCNEHLVVLKKSILQRRPLCTMTFQKLFWASSLSQVADLWEILGRPWDTAVPSQDDPEGVSWAEWREELLLFLWQWGSCACDKGDQPLCAQLFRQSCADQMGLITLLSVPISVVTCSTSLGSHGGSVLGTLGSLVSKSQICQAWLFTTHPDLPHTCGHRATLSQEFWFYTKVLPTWPWSSHLSVLSGTHWLVFPLVFGLSQPEINDSDVAWVTYILHFTFKDCWEFCLRAPNLEHLVPTSGIPNKPATYKQAFSHRKQRSCSEIRSISVVVLWPRACLPPKPGVLAFWAWGWMSGVHQNFYSG